MASGVLSVLRATTAMAPSVFLNAVRSTLPLELVAPMRTAPGRTYRLELAKAHSRPDGVTVEPLIWMRLSLSPLPDGGLLPHQYRNALRLAAVSPAEMCCAQVSPDATVPSSQAGSQVSNVDHAVSQAGLHQPASVDSRA